MRMRTMNAMNCASGHGARANDHRVCWDGSMRVGVAGARKRALATGAGIMSMHRHVDVTSDESARCALEEQESSESSLREYDPDRERARCANTRPFHGSSVREVIDFSFVGFRSDRRQTA